jgi:hypothetical protein
MFLLGFGGLVFGMGLIGMIMGVALHGHIPTPGPNGQLPYPKSYILMPFFLISLIAQVWAFQRVLKKKTFKKFSIRLVKNS